MLLSTDIFDRPSHESRLSWDDFSDSPLSVIQAHKKILPASFTKLLSGDNIDNGYVNNFETSRPHATSSVSLESIALGAYFEEDEETEFPLPVGFPDDIVLEFDEKGQVLSRQRTESSPVEAAALPAVRLEGHDYYNSNLYLSWEDDLFAAALVPGIPKGADEVASPTYPLSPSFSADSDSECDGSDSESELSDSSSSSSDSDSDAPISIRRRQVKRNRNDISPRPQKKGSSVSASSEKANKPAPRTPLKPKVKPTPKNTPKKANNTNPQDPGFKRRRRVVNKKKTADNADIEVVNELLVEEDHVRSCPTPKKGKIGLLSNSTHDLSAEVIRNIFRAEQVVTLTKFDEEDNEEEIDIL